MRKYLRSTICNAFQYNNWDSRKFLFTIRKDLCIRYFFCSRHTQKYIVQGCTHTKKYIKLEARRGRKLALAKIENWTKLAIWALAFIKKVDSEFWIYRYVKVRKIQKINILTTDNQKKKNGINVFKICPGSKFKFQLRMIYFYSFIFFSNSLYKMSNIS